MASTTKKKTSQAKSRSNGAKKSGSKTKNTRSTSSKAKSQAKSRSNSRSKSSKNKKQGVRLSRMMLVCLILIFWIFALITMLKLGLVGLMFNQTLQVVIGSFLYIALPVMMWAGFQYIYTGGRRVFSTRTSAGLIVFGVCWIVGTALLATTPEDPYGPLSVVIQSMAFFGTPDFWTNYGVLGAGISGLLVSLFSRFGAWLFVIGFLTISLCLMFWDPVSEFLFDSSRTQQRQKARQKAISKKASRPRPSSRFLEDLLFEEEDELDEPSITIHQQQTVAPEPVRPTIFESGILMEGLDGPQVPGDSLVQQHLFEVPTVDERPKKEPARKAAPSKAKAARQAPDISSEHAPAAAQQENASMTDSVSVPDVISNVIAAEARNFDEPPKEEPSEPEIKLYDPAKYKLPPVSLLEENTTKRSNANVRNARTQGQQLIDILKQFNVDATLGEVHIGPSVTEFEVIPGQGVRVSAFTNLQNDIKMALAATDIRVEAPISGKSAVGIEVPNAEKTMVTMKELIRNVPPKLQDKPLMFTLGKDLMGNNVYGRLDTMPHLLIAGATGSGKSVCVNSIICSILLRTRPDEVKLLLVDPKKVEFTPYNGIPHLLSPVITDANLASGALKVIVEMMDARYSLFEELTVRNISSYNEYVKQNPDCHKEVLPRIVVIIDELADLMLAASKDVEQSIQRITQLARAAGIHLIVATQRPSVNVITGVIKANIPSRIAFMVSSRPDSRTILDQSGAEKLLGYGDMLFLDNGASSPVRLQGVYIQDKEVEEICSWVKSQASPAYEDAFVMLKEINSQGGEVSDMAEEMDPLYPEVKNFVIVSRKASTSLIQRRFRLGYGRAARILDQLEANGIVGPSNGSRPREILVERPADDLQEEEY
ncbi:DNA translocase FtsK [Erysipelotrichaceae bacterium 51-3]